MTQIQLDALKKAVEKPNIFLLAHEIGPTLGYDPQWIRIEGRAHRTPYPSQPHGKCRVDFPKAPFLRYVESLMGIPVEKILEMEAES